MSAQMLCPAKRSIRRVPVADWDRGACRGRHGGLALGPGTTREDGEEKGMVGYCNSPVRWDSATTARRALYVQ